MSLEREKLPKKRNSYRYEGRVGGHRFYLTLSFYEDGRLGEIFIDLGKEGAELKMIYAQLSMMASRHLQHGLPASKIVDWWSGTQSETQGILTGTGLEDINGKSVSSLLDAIALIIKSEVL